MALFTEDRAILARIDAAQGLIFDMDGTIMDSEGNHHKATNHMLKDLGLPPLSEEVLDSYAGLPETSTYSDVLKRIKESGAVSAERLATDPRLTLEALCRTKRKLYEELYMPQNIIYESMVALIKDYAAQGKRIALATSSPRSQADFTLKQAGLTPYFHSIITGDMVKHGKPAPDIFLLAAKSLNLNPDACLVFEDGTHGLNAAKAAHIDALHCLYGKCQAYYQA